jgi:coatomer subunit gamma
MVHLVIKELASSAEDIIMVTSTIMKDTGGSTDIIYRPNAIRALCRIIDVGQPTPLFALLAVSLTYPRPPRSSPLSV